MAKAGDGKQHGEAIEAAVDEAIDLAGGDLRDAVRSLILGQQSYENELRRTVSAGYVRRNLTSR